MYPSQNAKHIRFYSFKTYKEMNNTRVQIIFLLLWLTLKLFVSLTQTRSKKVAISLWNKWKLNITFIKWSRVAGHKWNWRLIIPLKSIKMIFPILKGPQEVQKHIGISSLLIFFSWFPYHLSHSYIIFI